MAWEQLSINKPHLAYLIIGGFTSLFMLCSLFVKEKLYIGEATVATICGVIFGPHAANLFDPSSWGNTDQITLECSRIVLVVQCFAVGVELPKAYMERHWKSVTFLLVPVMTFGWLITSLFIWWMIEPLTWLESLAVSACVTATDPVLASSVVGKGKFAKRVPKHLRDVLSAESGCNDGMAFPFIYLSLYLIHYHLEAKDVVFHWTCLTILYECVFGAVYGFLIGYIGRHLIKSAHRFKLIDRESFLVFYFVLALFCAGSGSLLGMDDLLVGFSAGVGFSNDGWFTQKTEEAHVSNVIDLLLNLAYFVYFGSVIPWDQYNNPALGIVPWKLVVIAIFVIFFRRIPIMLALKPIIPDVKNWREALFAGHFGPIGVGAIFAAMLARAELETNTTEPLAVLPGPDTENYLLVQIIWPVVTFLVISSIIVHGSSIAVFTLGKRINTLTLTMSYTQANEPSWLNRLPRISSISRSMSKSKGDFESVSEADEPQFPPNTLPPTGLPGNFLRRQKEDDNPSRMGSRNSSLRPRSRKKWEAGMGPGGPISQSAIAPQRRPDPPESPSEKPSPRSTDEEEPEAEDDFKKEDDERSTTSSPDVECYQEGDQLIVEDEEGNILHTENTKGETKEEEAEHIQQYKDELARETSGEHAKHKHEPHAKDEGVELEHALADGLEDLSGHHYRHFRQQIHKWRHRDEAENPTNTKEPKRGPARAYQYGNTIIVEDEDGEVVKKYDLPPQERKKSRQISIGGVSVGGGDDDAVGQSLRRITTWVGRGSKNSGEQAEAGEAGAPEEKRRKSVKPAEDEDDHRFRLTLGGSSRSVKKEDFIKEIQSLDPKAQARVVDESNAPEGIKHDVKRVAGKKQERREARGEASSSQSPAEGEREPRVEKIRPNNGEDTSSTNLALVDSNERSIPFHPVSDSVSRYSEGQPETAAARRRRLASAGKQSSSSVPQQQQQQQPRPNAASLSQSSSRRRAPPSRLEDVETEAEKHRRLAALGQVEDEDDSSSDDDGGERQPKRKGHKPVAEPTVRSPGIRFADSPVPTRGRR